MSPTFVVYSLLQNYCSNKTLGNNLMGICSFNNIKIPRINFVESRTHICRKRRQIVTKEKIILEPNSNENYYSNKWISWTQMRNTALATLRAFEKFLAMII